MLLGWPGLLLGALAFLLPLAPSFLSGTAHLLPYASAVTSLAGLSLGAVTGGLAWRDLARIRAGAVDAGGEEDARLALLLGGLGAAASLVGGLCGLAAVLF